MTEIPRVAGGDFAVVCPQCRRTWPGFGNHRAAARLADLHNNDEKHAAYVRKAKPGERETMDTTREAIEADGDLELHKAVEYGAQELYKANSAVWRSTWEVLQPHERWFWRMRALHEMGFFPHDIFKELGDG